MEIVLVLQNAFVFSFDAVGGIKVLEILYHCLTTPDGD
jgi:hypothetical protein